MPVVLIWAGAAALSAIGLGWVVKNGIVESGATPDSDAGKILVQTALPIALIAVAVIILISIGRR